ncbi:hypothetical protein BN14_08861 [Rhizoctonia solani AG-1 IB]|uniref:Uncharacterized protein n=2 Tax=Rhizoctonia solani TaxID=456999 RepID=A0A8H2XIX3_9AGAM|nr:unnamed protein product [Rhizoctonia solani]CCO34754.1 hypothetical protein BN14_08861 [Rhizoctonia solani AG-1 IB]
MGISSRKYVDLIFKASGKYGNWDPPHTVEVGDWGEIDKNTGNFVREGNIFKDSECAPLLSETASNLEELVKKGNPEDVLRITAGAKVELKNDIYTDIGGTGELGARVQGAWEFTPQNRAALLTVADAYSNYLETGVIFPKLRQLPRLKGKAIVTEALHCPAYALLLTEKGKGGKAALSLYTGVSQAGAMAGGGAKASWRYTSESGFWRTACGYRMGDGEDAVYTPLYRLEKIASRWRIRYRGAPPSGATLEDPVHEDYLPPWEMKTEMKSWG